MPVARVDVGVRLLVLPLAGSSSGICAATAVSSPKVNADRPSSAKHEEEREQPELADAAPLRRTIPFPEQRQNAR